MNVIVRYPEFSPLSFEAIQSIKNDLQSLKGGISELTLGSLYFFKDFYTYHISKLTEHTIIFRGKEQGTPFFFHSRRGCTSLCDQRTLYRLCLLEIDF